MVGIYTSPGGEIPRPVAMFSGRSARSRQKANIAEHGKSRAAQSSLFPLITSHEHLGTRERWRDRIVLYEPSRKPLINATSDADSRQLMPEAAALSYAFSSSSSCRSQGCKEPLRQLWINDSARTWLSTHIRKIEDIAHLLQSYKLLPHAQVRLSCNVRRDRAQIFVKP